MNRYFYELSIKSNIDIEVLSDFLLEFVEAIEYNEDELIVRSESDLSNLEYALNEFSSSLTKLLDYKPKVKIVLEKKENIDWIKAYQDSVQPIEVGEFYIHPSWQEPNKNKLNILIDPALTFGSGHHETTSTCLESITKYIKKDQSVIDVGCGSGILGIAASKLGAIIDICDTDIVAIDDAVNNFQQNNVEINHYWEGSANGTDKEYDVVIANIVADVIIMISKDIKKITKDNGIIILSGIMEQYKPKVLKQFKEYKLIEELQQNEWVTLILKKGNNEQ